MKASPNGNHPNNQLWAHVDINSYFATLLQQENPYLRNKPVGVLKAAGRTCIIAASKEAKTYGVITGCRLAEARALCPKLITVPAPFDLCLSATRQLRTIFTSFVPDVEIFSLDEAFLDLRPCRRLYPDPFEFGKLVQHTIKETLGSWVTCNVGIGRSRLLAKMTGEISPKGSVTQVTENTILGLLASTPFSAVCGIGHRLKQRLCDIGISSLLQVSFLSDEELVSTLGPFWAVEVRKMSGGEDPELLQRIHSNDHMKCVSRTITGYGLCDSEEIIKRTLYNLTLEVITKVRIMKLAGRRVSMFVQGRDESWRGHHTSQSYLQHTAEMFSYVYDRLYKTCHRTFPVLRFGVALSLLKEQSGIQEPLFSTWHTQERLESAVDSIREKYGNFAIRSGLLTTGPVIKQEVTGYLGDKKFYGLE